MPILITHQRPAGSTGLFGKLLSGIVAALTLVVALAFSVVGLAVAGVLAVVVGGYLWWKLRAVRRAKAEASATVNAAQQAKTGTTDHVDRSPHDGRVIEGECIREDRPAH